MEQYLERTQAKALENSFVSKVYGWMSLGLLTTAAVSYWVVNTPAMLKFIFSSRWIFFGLLIGELILVGYLSAAINKISTKSAQILFFLYAGLNGLTLSFIFLVYTASSIASTFLVTALTFGVMSVYGYTTKKDLTGMGNFMLMGLLGIIIASLVNIFLHSPAVYWVVTYIGVFVFVGLAAYDAQRIKNMAQEGLSGSNYQKAAILGALAVYLDFINLFLFLLRIMGRRD